MSTRSRPRPFELLWGLLLVGVGLTVLASRALGSSVGTVPALLITLTACTYLVVRLRGLRSSGSTVSEG